MLDKMDEGRALESRIMESVRDKTGGAFRGYTIMNSVYEVYDEDWLHREIELVVRDLSVMMTEVDGVTHDYSIKMQQDVSTMSDYLRVLVKQRDLLREVKKHLKK